MKKTMVFLMLIATLTDMYAYSEANQQTFEKAVNKAEKIRQGMKSRMLENEFRKLEHAINQEDSSKQLQEWKSGMTEELKRHCSSPTTSDYNESFCKRICESIAHITERISEMEKGTSEKTIRVYGNKYTVREDGYAYALDGKQRYVYTHDGRLCIPADDILAAFQDSGNNVTKVSSDGNNVQILVEPKQQ